MGEVGVLEVGSASDHSARIKDSMRFMALLSKVTCTLLGERDVHASASIGVLTKGTTYFTSGRSAGYRVEADESGVIIKHHSKWAALAGLPSLYYFKGTFLHSGNEAALVGRVLMIQPVKGFILTWIGVVLMTLVVGIALAMFKAAALMTMGAPSLEEDLSTAGFLVGAVILLAAFGALVIGSLRAIKSKEREGLIRFCKSVARNPNAIDPP